MRLDHRALTTNPGYEMPSMPTRGSVFSTCFSTQTIVSQVSVASSMLFLFAGRVAGGSS